MRIANQSAQTAMKTTNAGHGPEAAKTSNAAARAMITPIAIVKNPFARVGGFASLLICPFRARGPG
jgi:hypothetical protein